MANRIESLGKIKCYDMYVLIVSKQFGYWMEERDQGGGSGTSGAERRLVVQEWKKSWLDKERVEILTNYQLFQQSRQDWGQGNRAKIRTVFRFAYLWYGPNFCCFPLSRHMHFFE